jgi:ATP-dependent DNA helicase DinG
MVSLPDSQSASSKPIRALVAKAGKCVAALDTGEVDDLDRQAAIQLLEKEPVLVCHAGFIARRLGLRRPARRGDLFDILELFAFAFPARACVPTPSGLARVLGLAAPEDMTEEAAFLHIIAGRLLEALQSAEVPHPEHAASLAPTLSKAGWAWGPAVEAALVAVKRGPLDPRTVERSSGFDIWHRLPEWEERAPEPPAGTALVSDAETEARLETIIGSAGQRRQAQSEYAKLAATALAPKDTSEHANVTLAEAGTGLGKTLGYLAPISVWGEKNGPGIWIATFTKNLQRQLDQELSRVYPDPEEKARWTVIRKGRENYLCLLNYQDVATRAMSGLGGMGQIETGLIARWALASRDGDMVGGDYPAWLETGLEHQLTDRRGECIYSACPHYRRCVIEKSVRKARRARIVVANHALVLTQSALDMALQPVKADAQEDSTERQRFLFFDEGHHLFNAADAAYSSHLTGLEASELRRWIRGPEGRRGARARGLIDRIGDLTGADGELEKLLQQAVRAARALPGEGWTTRAQDGAPQGSTETFLSLVRAQITARMERKFSGIQSWETDVRPLSEGIGEAGMELEAALGSLATPLLQLAKGLRERLDEEAKDLETTIRVRIEAAARGLERRAALTLPAWRGMLQSLSAPPPEAFVDWFAMENRRGRIFDVGMHRHWVDPSEPLARTVLERAQGVFITSATLRDTSEDEEADDDWQSAEVRTGTAHLAGAAKRASFASPFDYVGNTKILIVNDIGREDADQVSAAFRELFKAAGGGALGLFTAIHRLRGVHERIAEPLEAAGLPLFAQHVDAMDTGTLVDIFRNEEHACLLGTDAVRDGIDVPGSSLRLIVFDRVPWPRPDILHRARREKFGARTYDDLITRLRLKQAYGRLIRHENDRGVFVMLDSRTPTRLLNAFPKGVEIERLGLAEAIGATGEFLQK